MVLTKGNNGTIMVSENDGRQGVVNTESIDTVKTIFIDGDQALEITETDHKVNKFISRIQFRSATPSI
jgi:hypothetical protein